MKSKTSISVKNQLGNATSVLMFKQKRQQNHQLQLRHKQQQQQRQNENLFTSRNLLFNFRLVRGDPEIA